MFVFMRTGGLSLAPPLPNPILRCALLAAWVAPCSHFPAWHLSVGGTQVTLRPPSVQLSVTKCFVCPVQMGRLRPSERTLSPEAQAGGLGDTWGSQGLLMGPAEHSDLVDDSVSGLEGPGLTQPGCWLPAGGEGLRPVWAAVGRVSSLYEEESQDRRRWLSLRVG